MGQTLKVERTKQVYDTFEDPSQDQIQKLWEAYNYSGIETTLPQEVRTTRRSIVHF
jgi:hypothetical protein